MTSYLFNRTANPLGIILAGGGTGGHVMPGIALAEEILSRYPSARILFIGSETGIERTLVPDYGFDLAVLPDVRVRGKLLGPIRTAAKLPIAVARANRILAEFRPDAIIGLGGYASFAPILAGAMRAIPMSLMEQNAVPGRTNRHLSRFVDTVFNQFEDAALRFPNPDKCVTAGNPLRHNIIKEAAQKRSRVPGIGMPPAILVAGGSQGAKSINDLIVSALPAIKSRIGNFSLMHQCGRDDITQTETAASAAGVPVDAFHFKSDMEACYRRADLVVARAGATTIAEITAFGLPAILIPYPHAKDDHQTANAAVLRNAGAAVLLPQSQASPSCLAAIIADIVNPMKYSAMAAAAFSLAKPDAGKVVIDRLFGETAHHHAA